MFDFDSRETYLAARAEWRMEYALLTTKIREKRLIMRTSHDDVARSGAQYQRAMLRSDARKLMERRAEMTERMREQVAASREQEAA